MAGIAASAVLAGFVLPGPIEGFWDPRVLACMCDSRNLVEFRDGLAFVSSDHLELRGQKGRYYKEDGVWIWECGTNDRVSKIRLYPTWFLLRIESDALEEPLTGYRILWPATLAKARDNLSPHAPDIKE